MASRFGFDKAKYDFGKEFEICLSAVRDFKEKQLESLQ